MEEVDERSMIKQQYILMHRALENDQLLQALAHCNDALSQLRNTNKPLQSYYQVYIYITEKFFQQLSKYLVNGHNDGKIDLNDVYETVQYTGNILPRLYLMVLVGSCYLHIKGSMRAEIIKDLVEMCRGVQDPIRAMFLRWYLGKSVTSLLLTDEFKEIDASFKCDFVMTNLIEMNRVWIRLQYQGLLKERIHHVKDREDIRTLIGEQLLDLGKVIGNDIELYKNDNLPILLQHIIQCNDVLSQTYLFDVMLQVFPVSFHLDTLNVLLNSTMSLHHDVSINEVVMLLIERINSKVTDNIQLEDCTETFWSYLNELHERAPHISLLEFIPLLEGIMDLSLNENKVNNINGYLELLNKKLESKNTEITNEEYNLLSEFLVFKNFERIRHPDAFALKVLTKSKSYTELIKNMPIDIQEFVINQLFNKFFNNDQLSINSKAELEQLLAACTPLVENYNGKFNMVNEMLMKLIHFIVRSWKLENIDNQIEILLILKNWFSSTNISIKERTNAIIITKFWELIRLCDLIKKKYIKHEKIVEKYNNSSRQLFKHVLHCISDMLSLGTNKNINDVYKLYLQTGSLADTLMYGSIAYDFFSEGFQLYEKQITDSADQVEAIAYMVQTLQKTKSLFEESNYESLIIRCTMYASKLFKKQDQCRTVLLCSHLWWSTRNNEKPNYTEGSNVQYKEGKRVFECIQKSLKIADSIMDNIQSSQLMIEVLETCIYFFNNGDTWETHIKSSLISGIIALINSNIESLKLEVTTTLKTNNSTDSENEQVETFLGPYDQYISIKLTENTSVISHITKVKIPIDHFARTCKYINSLKQEDERFKFIKL